MTGRPQSDGEASERVPVGTASRLLGVSPGTLRVWESQGLVAPERDAQGERRYSPADLERLRQIRYLRSVERLNAAAIRRLPAPMIAEQTVPVGLAERIDRGRRLRHDRHAARLTLKEATDLSGLSVSFISAVERGTAGASPTAITRLEEAYRGFPHPVRPDSAVRVRRKPEGKGTTMSDGVRIEWLSELAGLLEPQLYILRPEASSRGVYEHGGEEFIYVVVGELTLKISEAEHLLTEGDSIHFESRHPHSWINSGSSDAQVLWVTTERGVWGKAHSRPRKPPGDAASTPDSEKGE